MTTYRTGYDYPSNTMYPNTICINTVLQPSCNTPLQVQFEYGVQYLQSSKGKDASLLYTLLPHYSIEELENAMKNAPIKNKKYVKRVKSELNTINS